MLSLLCTLLWADEFQSSTVLQYNRLSPFALGQDRTNGQEQWFSGVIQAQYQYEINKALSVDFGLEISNNLLYGDASLLSDQYLQPINRSQFQLWPQKIRIKYQSPHLRISLGTQMFQWGLGLFYSDGSHPSWFGYNSWNDSYAGLALAYSPLAVSSKNIQITLFSSANWILRNEYLSVYNGEGGLTLFNGVLLSFPFAKAGLLFAPTWEENQSLPIDVYVQLKLLDNLSLEGEYLYRWVVKDTPTTDHGGAIRLKSQTPPFGYAVEVGQINPTSNFRRHRNNSVGVILFPYYLPRRELLNDPNYSVQSSVTRAQYVHGITQFQSKKHGMRLGYLYARDLNKASLGHEVESAFLFLLTPNVRLTMEGALLLPLKAWYGGVRFHYQYQQKQKKKAPKKEKPPW